jgi:hypothetical protein
MASTEITNADITGFLDYLNKNSNNLELEDVERAIRVYNELDLESIDESLKNYWNDQLNQFKSKCSGTDSGSRKRQRPIGILNVVG